ncbi:hypothetical protein B0O80DRAFT_54113 [Mortierella sp. GBAus27b]|nr:hypothetical protein B0O80DRAFT_54113 [Mortierella sp. GBAus27b]
MFNFVVTRKLLLTLVPVASVNMARNYHGESRHYRETPVRLRISSLGTVAPTFLASKASLSSTIKGQVFAHRMNGGARIIVNWANSYKYEIEQRQPHRALMELYYFQGNKAITQQKVVTQHKGLNTALVATLQRLEPRGWTTGFEDDQPTQKCGQNWRICSSHIHSSDLHRRIKPSGPSLVICVHCGQRANEYYTSKKCPYCCIRKPVIKSWAKASSLRLCVFKDGCKSSLVF